MVSTAPPPPKSGGSGPFIIAAILMLLLMGGLIYWKVSGSSDEPKKVEAPAATATSAAPVFDEPPPPPPPPAPEEDAGKPDDKPKVKGALGANPCAKGCSGSPSAALSSALRSRAAQSRRCYEHALRTNSMLAGRMSVQVSVGANGTVCGASVTSNELGDASIVNCVLQNFRAAPFPAPDGGCATIQVPLNFQPKQ